MHMTTDYDHLKSYVLHYIRNFWIMICTSVIICSLLDIQKSETQHFGAARPWNGYDPSRPVTDVKALDYENKRITYRTYPNTDNILSDQEVCHQGVRFSTEDGVTIHTKLTSEELFEQLDLEYEDLYEYYMD